MHAIKADGSDRLFLRTTYHDKPSVTIHPSEADTGLSEATAFYNIGTHLINAGINAPEIYNFDPDTGTLIVEDLGNVLFYDEALKLKEQGNAKAIVSLYRRALGLLDLLQQRGTENFDTSWCYDTPLYDSKFAFNREALYFMKEFLWEYCNITPGHALEEELYNLCSRVDSFKGDICLMHRDFQSRNLMIRGNHIYVIDFQGARMGPFGYDPASLIYDPYINLPEEIRNELTLFFLELYKRRHSGKSCHPGIEEEFYTTALLRLLQALGAYGFLILKRHRSFFSPFMKPAIQHINDILKLDSLGEMPTLKRLISQLSIKFIDIEP